MASTPMLGAIFIFAGNFAPSGYQLCQGQLLPISQYAALFSILGTTYGGNGTTNFALPDLRGRSPIGWGTGTGLSPVNIGQHGGVQNLAIQMNNMPVHNHLINCDSTGSANTSPAAGIPGNPGLGQQTIWSTGPANATMSQNMVSNAGGSVPLNIENPYLGISYIIAMVGIFPSRN